MASECKLSKNWFEVYSCGVWLGFMTMLLVRVMAPSMVHKQYYWNLSIHHDKSTELFKKK